HDEAWSESHRPTADYRSGTRLCFLVTHQQKDDSCGKSFLSALVISSPQTRPGLALKPVRPWCAFTASASAARTYTPSPADSLSLATRESWAMSSASRLSRSRRTTAGSARAIVAPSSPISRAGHATLASGTNPIAVKSFECLGCTPTVECATSLP